MTTSTALPAEETLGGGSYEKLIERLSRQSVAKHFDAYADVAWDDPEYRIDPDDPRWELGGDDPLGATAWYRAQPPGVRLGQLHAHQRGGGPGQRARADGSVEQAEAASRRHGAQAGSALRST